MERTTKKVSNARLVHSFRSIYAVRLNAIRGGLIHPHYMILFIIVFINGCKSEPVEVDFFINNQKLESFEEGKRPDISEPSKYYKAFSGNTITLRDDTQPKGKVKVRKWYIKSPYEEQSRGQGVVFTLPQERGWFPVSLCINPDSKLPCATKYIFIEIDNSLPVDTSPPVQTPPNKTDDRNPKPPAPAPTPVIGGVKNAKLSLDGRTAFLNGIEDGDYEMTYAINGNSQNITVTSLNKRIEWPLALDAERENRVNIWELYRAKDKAKARLSLTQKYGKLPTPPPPTPGPTPAPASPISESEFTKSGRAGLMWPTGQETDQCIKATSGVHAFKLTPIRPIEITSFVLYANSCGGLKVDIKGPGISESFKVSLIRGRNQVSLGDLFARLLANKTYTITCTSYAGHPSCNSESRPYFLDGKSCVEVKPQSSSLLSLDQGGAYIITDVKFLY